MRPTLELYHLKPNQEVIEAAKKGHYDSVEAFVDSSLTFIAGFECELQSEFEGVRFKEVEEALSLAKRKLTEIKTSREIDLKQLEDYQATLHLIKDVCQTYLPVTIVEAPPQYVYYQREQVEQNLETSAPVQYSYSEPPAPASHEEPLNTSKPSWLRRIFDTLSSPFVWLWRYFVGGKVDHPNSVSPLPRVSCNDPMKPLFGKGTQRQTSSYQSIAIPKSEQPLQHQGHPFWAEETETPPESDHFQPRNQQYFY